MHFRTILTLALGSSALALASAQTPLAARPDLEGALRAFRGQHGSNWSVAPDHETGWAQMLYGGHTDAAATLPRDDADFVALGIPALTATSALHGLELSTLVFQDTVFLPLGQIGSTDKQTVRYRQAVDGVAVDGGFVNVLFSFRGELLSVQTTALPGASSIATAPELDSVAAAQIARNEFEERLGVPATTSTEPVLLIAQVLQNGERVGRLAWKLDCGWESPDAEPLLKHVTVDALTGTVLRFAEGIHAFDVGGNVKTMASPGMLPDIASNPETAQNAPLLRCQAGANTVFTDASGNFNFVGLNSNTSVTFTYFGTYAQVNYAPGTDYSLVQTLPPGSTNVVMNPTSSATVTPQANAYLVTNLMRPFIKSLVPSDNHGDFVTLSNTNASGSCNAIYNGSSLNFFPAGSGCVNSAYSTIISHEQGHWMNDRYNTGNDNNGMGEGNADVWSMYIWDSPIIGANFVGAQPIRNGDNLRQFCGDANDGCYGESHDDGEPWMGAAWKVRKNLNTALGNSQGDLTANLLFLGWMNSYNQSLIRSIIETQWMTLDDDNGNLVDGAPHFAQIDAGFRTQGFPGLVISCPGSVPGCIDNPNSVSATGANMDTQGSLSIATNNLELLCFNIPPNKLTIFYYGRTANAFTTFGNGTRCVDSPLYRLPSTISNAFGDAQISFNLNSTPPGGNMVAGNHMAASAYYRDPGAGGANFNTADVVEFNWCP